MCCYSMDAREYSIMSKPALEVPMIVALTIPAESRILMILYAVEMGRPILFPMT
jgi:hypothetical protein